MLLDRNDIVTIDYETYYSSDYSLRKKHLNTSGYIRHPEFKAHCIGIKDGTKATVWYAHDDIPWALQHHDVANRPFMAHNAAFDGFITSEVYGIIPPLYLCTLSMARALHGTVTRNDLDSVSKLYGRQGKVKAAALKKVKGIRDLPPNLLELLAEYMVGDTDECYAIGDRQLTVFPDKEIQLIDWTIRAFCDPVLYVNQQLAQEEYDEQVALKKQKQTASNMDAETLQSAELFAEALRAVGIDPPLKVSKTTGQLTYAFSKTDSEFTRLLEHDDEAVVRLVEARLATKSTIGETRARRFLDIGSGTLPVGNNYCGAHTTRWSGSNKMNLQNLNRGGRLRESIIAPPGHMIVVCDSGQIEARKNGWFNGHETLLEIFRHYDDRTGPDPYRVQAAANYGKPIEDITKDERFIGKICVLALGYQMGAPRLQATLALGLMGPAVLIQADEAKRIVQVYRTTNEPIVKGWDRCTSILIDLIAGRSGAWRCIEWEDDTVWLPNGLGLHYPGLAGIPGADGDWAEFYYYVRGKQTKIYGGLLLENIIQALSRVTIGDQLLAVQREFRDRYLRKASDIVRVVSMTHDEIISVVPERFADEALALNIKIMRQAPSWCRDIPLNAEGGYAVNYSK
jgi:hypothetical protein